MLPASIRVKLSSLRMWEVFLRLFWGVGRWLALLLLLLLPACLVDWLIDRLWPTPWPMRVLMTGVQIGAALAAVYFFLVRPLTRRLSDNAMALMVEEKKPELNHRLISVVQFHRPGADTQGMSAELIGKVTEETVQRSSGLSFLAAADARRLGWAMLIAVPLIALALAPLLLWPDIAQALLQRQMLLNVEIPRSILIEPDKNNPRVWPIDERVELVFRVRGPAVPELTEDSRGVLRLWPDDAASVDLTLKPKGQPGSKEAVFAAVIPPDFGNFTYRAWLLDGRSTNALDLKYVARPVVLNDKIRAWTQLPEYVIPALRRYEIEQKIGHGDIRAIKGSFARVRIEVSKPVREAQIQFVTSQVNNPSLLARSVALASGIGCTGAAPLLVSFAQPVSKNDMPYLAYTFETAFGKRLNMKVNGSNAAKAEVEFKVPGQSTGYRVFVKDKYGFGNIPAPKRHIQIIAEEPPQVALLPDMFPPDTLPPNERDPRLLRSLETYFVHDAPIPVNSRFRIAYACTGPYGLGAARFKFRIHKKKNSSGESGDPVEPVWWSLQLEPVKAAPNIGPFDPRFGAFSNSDPEDQIKFYAVPADKTTNLMGKTSGGGRFDVELKGLHELFPDGSFKEYNPNPGDEIEYAIEVSPDPKFAANRPIAISEIRKRVIVSKTDFLFWFIRAKDEYDRISKLKDAQGKVLNGK